MQLLDLTPAEVAFLSEPPAAPDALPQRLSGRLAAMLTARLQLPIQALALAAPALAAAPAAPVWQPDAALATLWLTRRLGGQRMAGVTSFVPRSLIESLDAWLAECWLDAAAPTVFPGAMAWRIGNRIAEATLAVQFPRHSNDMTRWARGVIRNG